MRLTIMAGTMKHAVAAFKRADGSVDGSVTDIRWGVGDYATGAASDASVSISPNAGTEIDVWGNAPSPLDGDGLPIPTIIEVGGDSDERDGSTKVVRQSFEVVVEDPNRDADHIELSFV